MIAGTRILLRDWRDDDLDPFAAMSADAEVMRHLNGPVDRAGAAAAIARQRAFIARDGHGFQAIERVADGAFLGFCGVRLGANPGTPVADDLEIGWRLRRDAWGQGYAREAAAAVIAWAWATLPHARIVALTVRANTASWGLMRRLGMTERADLAYAHPDFPVGHPLHHIIAHALDRPA